MKSFAFAMIVAFATADPSFGDYSNYAAKYNKSYQQLSQWKDGYANFVKFDSEVQSFNSSEKSSKHDNNFLSDLSSQQRQAYFGLNSVSGSGRLLDGVDDTDGEDNEDNEDSNSLGGQKSGGDKQEDNSLNAGKNGAGSTTPSGSGGSLTAYVASEPVNWTKVNVGVNAVVGPVKNQGACGSCWAFAANAVMESATVIAGGPAYNLSEQQIVDCAGSAYGNSGCNGGWPDYGWNYAKTYPITTTNIYAYTAKNGTCKYTVGQGVVKAVTSTVLSSKSTTAAQIQAALTIRPHWMGIGGGTSYFQSYKSGVLTSKSSCGTAINHAVTGVGYGTDATYGPYFLIRNSWGASWGSSGYVKISSLGTYPGVCSVFYYIASTTTTTSV